MNEAEKEAEEILFMSQRNMKDQWGFHESAKKVIAQALQKKQDEIERLTAFNSNMAETIKDLEEEIAGLTKKLDAEKLLNGKLAIDSAVEALRLEVERLTARNKELESKLAVAREALRLLLDCGHELAGSLQSMEGV